MQIYCLILTVFLYFYCLLNLLRDDILISVMFNIRDLKELSDRLPKEKRRLQEAEQEIVKIIEEEKITTKAIQKHRLSIDEVRNAMQANKSRNKVLNYLMDKKHSGEIPGIFGRLVW